jgi:polyhydroxybutyrate depolymerase
MKIGLILLALSLVGAAAPLLKNPEKVHTLRHQGLERTFRVFSPEPASFGGSQASPARLLPVVLALHGGATDGLTLSRYTGLSEKAAEAGFIVVYPDGTGRLPRVLTWNSGACCGYARDHDIDDVGFLRKVAAFVVENYRGDPGRVYATGISNGAMMAYRLAAEAPDLVAAVAAVAGTLDVDPAEVKRPKPVLHFHGSEDEYIPWGGGRGPRTALAAAHRSVAATIETWVRVNGAGPEPETTVLPNESGDGTEVIRHYYRPGNDGCEVILYEIRGGGHTWPGRARAERLLGKSTAAIDANDILWEFFSRHTLRKG